MKALYAFLVCVMLSGCGVAAQPPPTATATITRTLTPQPNLTATKRAIQAATQTMRVNEAHETQTEVAKPTATALAKAASALEEITNAANGIEGIDIQEARLAFGPRDDEITDTADDFVATFDPGFSVANFVASIKFINPYDTATRGKWDYGFFFRNQYGDKQYRLVVLSNQSWTLLNGETGTYIYSSNDKNLKAQAGEENAIWLIVIDKKAHLFVNGSYAKSMDLGNGPARGDVSPATGVYYGNVLEAASSTEFRDFMVWRLP